MALLSVRNVEKTFLDHHYAVHVLRDVSLDVNPGEMIAITGPSGSGKTTLLNIMGLVIKPDFGEIDIDGKKASEMNDRMRCEARNRDFGYIVQDFALIEEDTAMRNILIPTLYAKPRKRPKVYREEIHAMAEKMQIREKMDFIVKKLSEGERQRVAIIRSMINGQKSSSPMSRRVLSIKKMRKSSCAVSKTSLRMREGPSSLSRTIFALQKNVIEPSPSKTVCFNP